MSNAEAQIERLVKSLTKKNFKSVSQELHQLTNLYGRDAQFHLISSLVAHVTGGKDQHPQAQLLSQELKTLTLQENCGTCLCAVLESSESLSKGNFPGDYVSNLGNKLSLPVDHQALFGLALMQSSNSDIRKSASSHLQSVLPQLIKEVDRNADEALLQKVVLHLLSEKPEGSLNETGIALLMKLKTAFPANAPPSLLSPLLHKLESITPSTHGQVDDLQKKIRNSMDLAQMMYELGHGCIASPAAATSLLTQIDKSTLTPQRVARVLGMMAHTPAGLEDSLTLQTNATDNTVWEKRSVDAQASWISNIDNFVSAVNQIVPKFDWKATFGALDYPGFSLVNLQGLGFLLKTWKSCSKESFPIDAICDRWSNKVGQFSIMMLLFDPANVQTAEVTTITSACSRKLKLDEIRGIDPSEGNFVPWFCLDLVAGLMYCSESEVYTKVISIVGNAAKARPEIVALSVAVSTPASLWVACQEATVHSLTPRLVQTAQVEPSLLQRLFAARPASVVGGLSRHYNSLYNAAGDSSAVHPLLDLLKSIKCLEEVLKHPTSSFVFDLAVVAAHREFLNLDKWAKGHLEKNAAIYVPSCTVYLKDRLGRPDASDRKAYYQTLLATLDETSRRDVMTGAKVVTEANHYVPTDPSAAQPSDINSELGGNNFSKQIDDEANTFFKKIYSGAMTIDEVVSMLKEFKNSGDTKQVQVFKCMICNLFDEHRFFPRYPEKELRITGQLFGAFVEHQLINYAPLGMALSHVLDALRQEPRSRMHQFGLCALGQFKDRLHEWPQYCASICQIAHFNTFPHELKTACQAGNKGPAHLEASPVGGTALDSPSFTPGVAPPSPGQSQGIFSQSNLDTLLARHVDHREPSTAVQDKIHFIFNNISESNVESKAKDLKMLIGKEHFPWMAQYFVVKRASSEPNYHGLYLNFLSLLQMPDLLKAILEETYRNIKLLLKSPKISSSSQERSLLKSLGAWLGLITLGRNKPILFKDVAIKELVLLAFEMGTTNLLYVIPFVAKVLEACAHSTIFRPPNPWVMAILSVLKELHQQPLKVNLKIEIEILCRKMSISIDDIPTSNHVPDILERQKRQAQLQTPPMMPGTPSRGRLTSDAGDKAEAAAAAAASPAQRANAFPLLSTSSVSSIGPYVVVNSSLTLFQQQPSLKPMVQMAIERAIQDIISPVVDRAIKIACVSSHKLTTKDFALEGDENKLRKAAHTMTQHLAGSLAMVFCKDPLRASIGNHLRTFLVSALNTDGKSQQQYASLVDQAVSFVPGDNLDLACALIEKTAIERAVSECDEGLAEDFRERQRWREMRPQQPFVDSQHYYAPGLSNLPPPLRPKVGGLDPMQLALYDNFERFSSVAPASTQTQQQQMLLAQQLGAPAAMKDPAAGQPQTKVADVQQAWERILSNLTEVEKAAPHYAGRDFSSLNASNDLHLWMRDIQAIVTQFPSRDLVNQLCFKLLVLLIDADNKILIDWCLLLLQHMQEMYKLEFAKELTKVYIMLDNDRKYNPQLVTRLLHARLLEAADIDSFLVKLMETGKANPRVISFVEEILHRCLLVEPRVPHLTPTEFIQTIDLLTKIAAHTKPPRQEQLALVDAINQLRKAILKDLTSARSVLVKEDPDDPPGLRDNVGFLFEEWIRLVNQPQKNEKAATVFISRLMQQGMLKTDDISSRFFRLCTDYAVTLCFGGQSSNEQESSVPQNVTNYHGVDAFGKLIVVLVKHFGESTRVALLHKVLSTVANVLTRDYEVLGLRFNQKPYFRIFANLLLDIHIPDESVNFQMLHNWANTLHVLRPAVVPGFIFSWLELVSHRNFMAKLLLCKAQPKAWQLLQRLLSDLLTYMGPFLLTPEISEPTRALYKGTLRVMLVLLHDFPEFLCEFHQSLCDVTPQNCIQMRNLILSAFPRTMRLPDPFTPNLKVDLLAEINQPPRIMSQYTAILESSDLRADTVNFLMTRSPSSFLVGLRARFLNPNNGDSPPTYNAPLINAFVLDVGIKAIEMVKAPSDTTITRGPPMEIFQHLASELDPEGRYIFFNAIANQLRYPNSHTHYFSCVILFLFAEAEKEVVKEQITRVLLERLIVNRPHPWGLLITFIELIKNSAYNFWSYGFVRCAPEIERLFESVARSCMYNQRSQPPHPAQQPEREVTVE